MPETGGLPAASNHQEIAMRTVRVVLAAVLLVACATAGFSQQKKKKGDEQTRSVQGAVTASDENPVVGAVVQLKNTKTFQIRSFITQEHGSYYFHGLSPDVDYELKAEFQGTESPTKTLSSFDSRKQASINLKLNPKK